MQTRITAATGFRIIGAFSAAVISFTIAMAQAADIVETPLNDKACETFTVGESGHSDRCPGPVVKGGNYQLIVHDRRARIDLEIVRPGEKRGKEVLRLSDYLGAGQRSFDRKAARWLVEEVAGQRTLKSLALGFEVEPEPYVQPIPLKLIIRLDAQGANDCVIATVSGADIKRADKLMRNADGRKCLPAFAQ